MKIILMGLALILIFIIISGCNELYLTAEEFDGDVKFSIKEVIITNTLEVYDFWRDENKIETSQNSKFVIIFLNIENNEDSWLALQSIYNGLIDDKGGKYNSELYIDINGSVYTVQQLSLINEGESFGMGVYIPSNSSEIKKIVYTIPKDRNPISLNIMFGLSLNEFDNNVNWYDIKLDIIT